MVGSMYAMQNKGGIELEGLRFFRDRGASSALDERGKRAVPVLNIMNAVAFVRNDRRVNAQFKELCISPLK